jgi:hypothetical protein
MWASLPQLISRVVALNHPSPGIARLKVAHQMAGGLKDAKAADANIADAMKAMAVSKFVGPEKEAQLRGVPTSSRLAWRSLVSTLADAERSYLSPSMGFGLGPPDHASSEIAEGLRYVTHITKLAMDLYTEAGPRFVRLISPTLKLLGDNPEALYYMAIVDASKAYVIRGCGASEVYFSLSVHAESKGTAFPKVVADINDSRLRYSQSGCFTLVLASGASPPGNMPDGATWLPMPADAENVVTRHYFEASPPAQLNPALEAKVSQRLHIEEMRSDTPQSSPLTDEEMARRLTSATTFLRSMTVGNEAPDPSTAPAFFSLVPNTIGPPQKWSKDAEGLGAVDIAYGGGRFLLSEGEALVIRGKLPKCRFANVVLWNRFLQTFEYGTGRPPVSLARPQFNLGRDDRFTLVLSATNPFESVDHEVKAAANWLASEGRAAGTIFFRFVLPEAEVEQPTTSVVQLKDVLGTLGA